MINEVLFRVDVPQLTLSLEGLHVEFENISSEETLTPLAEARNILSGIFISFAIQTPPIEHFRVPLNLSFRASLSAKCCYGN